MRTGGPPASGPEPAEPGHDEITDEPGRKFLATWMGAVRQRWPAGADLAQALADCADPMRLQLNYLDFDVHRRLLRRAHAVPGGLGRALNYLQQMGFVTRARPDRLHRWGSITLTLPDVRP